MCTILCFSGQCKLKQETKYSNNNQIFVYNRYIYVHTYIYIKVADNHKASMDCKKIKACWTLKLTFGKFPHLLVDLHTHTCKVQGKYFNEDVL